MQLDHVVALLCEELRDGNFVGVQALDDATVYRIARETWIEHQALPERSVLMIIQRHLYHQTYVGEVLFWQKHGLDPEVFR